MPGSQEKKRLKKQRKKILQTKRHCDGMIRTPPVGCESFVAVTKTELQTLNSFKAFSQFSNVRNPVTMTPNPHNRSK
jgi:hypothetical protein